MPAKDLTRRLRGHGLELGPGHQPCVLPSRAHVRYVDRWTADESRVLYPELGPDAPYPRIDIVADLDRDRLGAVRDASQDFVVASHVLEHLADPLALLDDIHRVLRPGGLLLLLLPDRTRTFDRHRGATPLAHLVAEHAAKVTVVDDDHVEEFLARAGPEAAYLRQPPQMSRTEFYEWHRRRSIHVHCWTQTEFDEVLDYAIATLHHRWALLERLTLDTDSIEFGYLLEKRSRWRLVPVGWRRWVPRAHTT